MTYLYLIAIIYGLLLGNYLSSAYHRIPRNIPINGISKKRGRKPHCSTCGHKLEMYEYFPVISWITTRFRCNYCGAKTPIDYFLLECGMMIIALVAFHTRPEFDVYFVLTLPFYSLIFLNAMLAVKHHKLFAKLVNFTIITGILIYLYLWNEALYF